MILHTHIVTASGKEYHDRTVLKGNTELAGLQAVAQVTDGFEKTIQAGGVVTIPNDVGGTTCLNAQHIESFYVVVNSDDN